MWPSDCEKTKKSPPPKKNQNKKPKTNPQQKPRNPNLVFVSLFLFGVIRNLIVSEWVFTTLFAGLLAMLKGPC